MWMGLGSSSSSRSEKRTSKSWGPSAIRAWGCPRSRRTRFSTHSLPPNLTAPGWDLASADRSLNRMADACGLRATLRAAQMFASPYPSTSTHRTGPRCRSLIDQIGFAAVDLGGLVEGGKMQQAGGALAGLNLVRLPGCGVRRCRPRGDEIQHAEDLVAVANHVAVARLAPAQYPLAIHDERRAVCDIALLVVYAIGADDRPVHVAQQREGEPAGTSERVMTERAVAADREQGGATCGHFPRDLVQVAELGRSDPAEVVAVEDQHDVGAPPEVGEGDGAAGRGRQRESGSRLAVLDRRHRAKPNANHRPVPRRARSISSGQISVTSMAASR